MRRRTFLGALSGLGMTSFPLTAAPKGGIIELRHYSMRNSADMQMQRTSEFIEKHALAAGKRAGEGVSGVFANLVGPNGPFLLLVNSYDSLAAMEAANEKEGKDAEFIGALQSFYAKPGLPYQRVDVTLLRAFDSMPKIEPPPLEEGKSRVFELRTYESNTAATLGRKIKMFEEGEIAIFRRLGMRPVFFGAAIAGANLPQLTYMLAYDSLAAREKAWQAFGNDPDWRKMRSQPGLSDPEIVSNIGNILLRPLPFSPIR